VVKLNNKKIAWIVRHVSSGEVSTKDAADVYGITQRRVQQLTKKYLEQGEIPKLNQNRRPRTSLTKEDKETIERVWNETRFGSRHLYKELKRRGYRIPKDKLIQYMRETGKSIPNPNKQKKRKRCRYEREHSFSLVHGDFHRRTDADPYAIIWLDDASRMILSYGEFTEATTDIAISTFKKAMGTAAEYCMAICEVNTDRGAQFYANRSERPSRFEAFLAENDINYIPSRRNNPQTNGKVERFWLEYDRHRFRFNTIEEFASWYNNRMHGALLMDIGETPNEAVVRKLPPEAKLGLFLMLGGE